MGRNRIKPIITEEQREKDKATKNKIRKAEKKLSNAKDFLKAYDDNLAGIVTNNINLQKRALQVIEDKIDEASAAQAATIYGILWDKVQGLVGNRGSENNTFNMYFGDNMKAEDMGALLTRVMDRMDGREAIEVEATEVNYDSKTCKEEQPV